MTGTPSYRLLRSPVSVGEFHARTVPEPATPEIWWPEIAAPALVLGSSQDESVVDRDACRAAGIDVVRRRSGGGAVLLVPGEVTWIDVIVPTGRPGWSEDVHASMVWLGRCLAAAITSATGIDDLAVHEGPMRTSPWSRLVCFDGIGAGEVLLGGRKLVGLSQRRTRHAARLQCCWYSAHDPARLVQLLDPAVRPSVDELAPVATLPTRVTAAVVERLVATLA